MAIFDVYWLDHAFATKRTGRTFIRRTFSPLVGIGGIWVAAFAWQLKKLPLLPLHDPRFEGVLLHEHGD